MHRLMPWDPAGKEGYVRYGRHVVVGPVRKKLEQETSWTSKSFNTSQNGELKPQNKMKLISRTDRRIYYRNR